MPANNQNLGSQPASQCGYSGAGFVRAVLFAISKDPEMNQRGHPACCVCRRNERRCNCSCSKSKTCFKEMQMFLSRISLNLREHMGNRQAVPASSSHGTNPSPKPPLNMGLGLCDYCVKGHLHQNYHPPTAPAWQDPTPHLH